MILFNTKILSKVGYIAFFLFLFFGCITENKSKDKNVSYGEPSDFQNPSRVNTLLYMAYQKNGGGYTENTEHLVQQYREALLGGMFWEQYQSSRISVNIDEVRTHYINNRGRFKRVTNQLRVLSFLLNTLEEADSIKNALSQRNSTIRSTIIQTYKASPKTISPGSFIQEADEVLFKNGERERVVGPIESKLGFHVFEVLDFFSAGSVVGLDEVYDEVSQEIYRNKRLVLFNNLLDSLTQEYKVFEINGEAKEQE